jgi:hypothetical protein
MVKAAVELVIVDSGATDASSYYKRKRHRRPVGLRPSKPTDYVGEEPRSQRFFCLSG